MARHRDSRSPSPTGSHHSSRRTRRDDNGRRDRDRRDDVRGPRHRSRSRSLDVRTLTFRPRVNPREHTNGIQRRERDRDMIRRRDRSVGRSNDDYHRSGRRDRSRDRRIYADRERSPDRRRRRSRERDYRDRRDDSYDARARRRREDSTDSWSRSRGDENRGQTPRSDSGAKANDVSISGSYHDRSVIYKDLQVPKVSAPAVQTEEQKKAERLAKLEAWKKKIAEDKERKEKELAAGGTRKLLDAIDQKASGSPSLTSPNSPATAATPGDLAPPTNYAGKFDPKAIAKKAGVSASSAHALGKDLPLKELSKASATLTSTVKGLQADKKPTAFNSTSKGKGNIAFLLQSSG